MPSTALLWFRRDLRLSNNPALNWALEHFDKVIPVYLHGFEADESWAPGAASNSWLHHSLLSLSNDLKSMGSRLVLRHCEDAMTALEQLVTETGADAVLWNRLYEPHSISRDSAIKKFLTDNNTETRSFNASLLFEPWEIAKNDGGPYRVFTPFWRACLASGLPSSSEDMPGKLPAVNSKLASMDIEELGLLSELQWDSGFYATATPGEQAALEVLESFLENAVAGYAELRDFPASSSTSRLSTCLHFGEISPRRILAYTQSYKDQHPSIASAVEAFERELGWREFAYHIIYHFPHTAEQPMFEKFSAFPWKDDAGLLKAWQKGQTGIPLVDAGMRELWHTGIMHNRVRMVVASFLTKNLLIPWQQGARWFWDTLVDADLASNSMGWQWTAGSGADAAPYFRIFNPVSQSKKFDSEGAYLRKWVPEIAELPDRYIHAPWEAPADILEHTRIYLDGKYPEPVVDLKSSRQRALDAYAQIKDAGQKA